MYGAWGVQGKPAVLKARVTPGPSPACITGEGSMFLVWTETPQARPNSLLDLTPVLKVKEQCR